MPIIEFKNFSFSYPDRAENTIENINFKIDEGEFAVMYGPTGSGKSTILRQIKRQIKPYGKSSGEILYYGKNIDEINELTSVCEIGFVFQNPESQLVADTVWHELAFSLENIGLKTEDMRKKIGEMACFFGLENLLDKSVHELSGGQKQIVNLCSVLLLQPKVLILDEPISQLDPINAREFLKIIYQLIRDFDVAVVLSEHRLEDVYFMADKIIVIDEGRVKYEGIPDMTAISSKNDENLKNFLPELSKLYFRYETDVNADVIIPKTIRDYKNWVKKFDVITGELPPARSRHLPPRGRLRYCNQTSVVVPKPPSVREVSRGTSDGGSNKANISISCKDVYFSYAKNQPDILKDLGISVNKGEILSVLGGNGAGKSTLLKILAGILKPQRGKVILHDKNINIGYLAQNPKAYFLYDTVEKEIFERAKSLGNPDYKYIDELINLFKIEKILKLHPYDISGGEQQLTAFLTVMLKNPDVLLLDEPTKGLDPNMKKAFFDILLNLIRFEQEQSPCPTDSREPAISVVIATHDIEFAAKYSDSCCFLFDGEIMSKEPSKKFFADNYFYTTSVSKIFRDYDKDIVCVEDVILNKKNN